MAILLGAVPTRERTTRVIYTDGTATVASEGVEPGDAIERLRKELQAEAPGRPLSDRQERAIKRLAKQPIEEVPS